MYIFRYYLFNKGIEKYNKEGFRFGEEEKNSIIKVRNIIENKIYEYIKISLEGDLNYEEKVDETFALISEAENNLDQVYSGGGQDFCFEFYRNQVTFYNNMFDEEDGWPDLSCSLHTFKTAFIAWNAFLQLPKSIHSVVETVIEE